MRVGVVGAGIMGASTALALAERGHEVVIFERHDPGHDLGSSHGHSRIIRKAYPDAFYTAIMDEGYGLWHDLQMRAGRTFVHESGLMYFGSFESENLRDVVHGLQQLSVPHEVLDPVQSKKVFPDLQLVEGEIAIFTPQAGWVDAEKAVRATLDLVSSLGGSIEVGREVYPEGLESDFDRFVLCPGPWIMDFANVPVRVSLQTFGYVSANRTAPVEGPVWIDDCEHFFYGFPSEPGKTSFKIGVHQAGSPIDARSQDRVPSAEHSWAITNEAAERFGIHEAEFEFKACLYTSTLDEDFLLGRYGVKGYFCSACSGHGFKFAPWLGRKLADFVEEKDAPENHPRFCWPKVKLEA